MKRLVLTIGLALVFGVVSHAEAGFLSGFTGNTVFGLASDGTETTLGDGIVNFAVYASEDADWRDDAAFSGTGGVTGGLDGTAAFVYMYQVVKADINPNGNDGDIDSFFVPIFSSDNFTSAGGFSGFAFDESGAGATGVATNLQLGTNTVTSDGSTNNSEDTFGDELPSESGASLDATAFVASDGFAGSEGVQSAPVNLPGLGVVQALEWQFNLTSGGITRGMIDGEYSSVLVYTSNIAPVYRVSQLTDGDNTFGDVPTVPAPGGLALVLAGLPGLLGLGWHQRRRKSAA